LGIFAKSLVSFPYGFLYSHMKYVLIYQTYQADELLDLSYVND